MTSSGEYDWGEEFVLSTGDVEHYDLAMNDDGKGVVVWSIHEAPFYFINSMRYSADTGWDDSPDTVYSSAYEINELKVAIDDEGNAIALWKEWVTTTNVVRASYYEYGNVWGPADLVRPDPSPAASSLRIAMDDSGNAIAVWIQDEGSYDSVFANRYRDGVGWGTTPDLLENQPGETSLLNIAMDIDGNALVVWRQFNTTDYNVRYNTFNVTDGWGVSDIFPDTLYFFTSLELAGDGDGNAMAIWCYYNTTNYDLYYRSYTAGIGWQSIGQIEDSSDSPSYPEIAMGGNGRAIAVWQQSDGLFQHVFASRFIPGSGWGSPERIESNLGNADHPRIAMDSSGNALVVWAKFYGEEKNLWGNRYDAGTGWRTALLLENCHLGNAMESLVEMDDDLNAIIIWRQNYNWENDIWALNPDLKPPSININSPSDGSTVDTQVVTVSGTTEPGASLVINGVNVAVGSSGAFSFELGLSEGNNTISATSTDVAGNTATKQITVEFVDPVSELQEELESVRDELDDTMSELNTAQEELESISDELDDAMSELNLTKDQLEVAESDIDRLDSARMLSIAGLVAAIIALIAALIALMLALRRGGDRRIEPPGGPKPPKDVDPHARSQVPKTSDATEHDELPGALPPGPR